MSVQPMNPVGNPTGEVSSIRSNQSLPYVSRLVEERILSLREKLEGIRRSENPQDKTITDTVVDSLKNQIDTLEKLMIFMNNENNDKNIT